MRFVRFEILACAAMLLAAGCGQSDDGGVVGVKRNAVALPEPGKMIAFAPVPIGYAGHGPVYDRELLQDGTFQQFDIAQPATDAAEKNAWHASSPDAAKSITKAVVPDASDTAVLAFAAASNSMYVEQTTLPLDATAPNSWLIATIDARCAAPNEFGVTLSFTWEGGVAQVGVAHPGDDQWHKVECRVPLLQPAPGMRLTMGVLKKNATQANASVRSASLRLVRSDEVTLLHNGSFEDYAFTGSIYPWRARSWGGAKPTSELLAEGNNHIVNFPPLTSDGAVDITQRVSGLTDADKGKTLTATASLTAGDPAELFFVIRPMKDQKEWNELLKRVLHSGDGKTGAYSVSLPLPQDKLPDELYIDIYRARTTQNKVTADDVTLTFAAPK